MYPGFQIREFFKHNANLPDARWFTQVARWIGNLFSSDGTVIVTPTMGGINLQVNTALVSSMAGASSGFVFAKVTSWTAGAGTCTADIYANGPTVAATQTGATVHLFGSSATVPPVNTTWLIVRQHAGATSPQEWDGVPLMVSGNYVTAIDDLWMDSNFVRFRPGRIGLTFDSAGKLQPQTTEPTNDSTLFQIDTTTEIDLSPQFQFSGGHGQTRCKKIMLEISSDTVPIVRLKASANYGGWTDGPATHTCT